MGIGSSAVGQRHPRARTGGPGQARHGQLQGAALRADEGALLLLSSSDSPRRPPPLPFLLPLRCRHLLRPPQPPTPNPTQPNPPPSNPPPLLFFAAAAASSHACWVLQRIDLAGAHSLARHFVREVPSERDPASKECAAAYVELTAALFEKEKQ